MMGRRSIKNVTKGNMWMKVETMGKKRIKRKDMMGQNRMRRNGMIRRMKRKDVIGKIRRPGAAGLRERKGKGEIIEGT